MSSRRFRTALLGASALVGAAALMASPAAARDARQFDFDMPAQPLTVALKTFGATADQQLIFSERLVQGREAPPLKGAYTPDQALTMLLAGSGLVADKTPSGVVTIRSLTQAPQGSSAAGGGAEVEALIVTAQKREEDIQDVPIAISAFTQEDLTRSQIAGGPDLITQVPNMTFTKTNFSSYSVQLRGIGTQAISATTDPAVAVAFNNTPFIRNRFFEQEFYDLQRVEVLRGPQGTLYGRNATAGVVNIISQKPKFTAEAKLSGDVSNYNSSRLEGMVNIPLVEDAVALRIAGAWTKRDGYATNEITGNPIDGRDLWSTRVSLRFTPTDRIDANLIWEHFEENDDRLRSGKQLCKKHVVTELAGFPVGLGIPAGGGQSGIMDGPQAAFNQGCIRVSLYSPEAFQTPQGYMLPFYMPLGAIGLPIARPAPYINEAQSQDLRVIESTVDPDYRAKADIGELQVSFDLTDTLTLTSETAYAADEVFSKQDYNRFNTAPGAWLQPREPGSNVAFPDRVGALLPGPNGGIFCDPQLGCSDRLIVVDLSTADARQFTQEFRLSSDFEGPFNFSLGANFMRADSMDKYYVFSNSFTLFTINGNFSRNDDYPPYVVGESDNMFCQLRGAKMGNPVGTELFNGLYPVEGCHYTDPNPIGSLNDHGHNYFLSKNPYKLISYAVFGEAYYNITDVLKVTAGLRWTVDKKEAPRIPSWLLAAESFGYPVANVIEQEWREPTGRLTIDWKPDLAFTDQTLLYGSYAHGYKAGGANPPPYVRAVRGQLDFAGAQVVESELRPKTFDAEFIDAFELGMKNTLLDGKVTANLAAFYYDYKDYQISEIVDRSAFNRNFDATVWGVELEVDWRPLENLRFGVKGGYQKTRIADGERAIDLMDRTAGDPRWVLARPFPTYASSCILPAWLLVGNTGADGNPEVVNARGGSGGFPTMCEYAYDAGLDPVSAEPYTPFPSNHSGMHNGPINYAAWSTNPDDYPGAAWPGGVVGTAYPGWDPTLDYGNNHGEGIFKDLSGNELPNAPQWTATITADYTIPLPNEWLATLHTDLHWQAQSWWRVFNDHEFSRLDEYFTMNLAAIFTNEERGWNVMAYVKNVTDETAITGAFLNSDDTGLTTNVFLTEPRLYGLRVTKAWSSAPWLTGFDRASGPFPLTVEIGGQIQRQNAPYKAIDPTFAAAFPSNLSIFDDAQNQDLDTGDGRSIRLTYQPVDSPWSVAAAMRYGRTNSDEHRTRAESLSDPACGFPTEDLCTKYLPPDHYQRGLFDLIQNFTHTNFADASVRDREEHAFIDFAVGKDVNLGGLHKSTFGVGLRRGKLESSTRVMFAGVPNWDVPEGWLKYPMTHDHFSAKVAAEREFEGTGPMLSWDASLALLGDDDTGHATFDWSLNGGVLFGRQKTSIVGVENESGYSVTGLPDFAYWHPPISTEPPLEIADERSKSASVPFVELSAGLSYEIRRIKIGAGYRWERYFDVLDVGFDEAKDADRTIDGPYFKLSVGFGG